MDLDKRREKFAIHEAAREGQTNVVESLLGANPKLASLRDDDERLPLHWAISYNHIAIVEILSQDKRFDVDAKDGAGWTPLMIASSVKDGEGLVDLLLRKTPMSMQRTALHFCASKSNLDVARRLLDHKATARVKDKRGQLPLHRAAAVGSVPMVQLMLDHRSPLNATDNEGQSALHHAIAEGHGDTAMLLLKAGIEAQTRDREGHLPIDLAPDSKIRDYIVRSAEAEGIDVYPA